MAHNAHEAKAERRTISLGRAWATIAILSILYVFSMVDRFALGLLVEALKRDLAISDVQVGLLFGSAFALFYGLITIPLARLADRGNRIRLIFFAAVLWSTCTVLSGFATSFLMLVLLRVGLAVGEAALVPSVFSLIGDALPPKRRTFGGVVFNCCGMAGASGAYLLSSGAISLARIAQSAGYFTDFREWQAVFITIGLPGIFLALLLAVFAREPARTAAFFDVNATSFSDVVRFIRSQGWLYPGVFVGAGCLVLGTNGFLAWTPTYLSRAYDLPIIDAGRMFGTYNLCAFVAASIIVPFIGGWVARYRSDSIVLIGLICAVLSTIFCVAAVFQSSWTRFLACSLVGLFLAIGGAGNTISSFHRLTPPRMRATLTSMLVIFLTTVALGIGPPLVGALAGEFGSGKAALGVGLGLVAALGGAISALLFTAARKDVLRYVKASSEDSAFAT